MCLQYVDLNLGDNYLTRARRTNHNLAKIYALVHYCYFGFLILQIDKMDFYNNWKINFFIFIIYQDIHFNKLSLNIKNGLHYQASITQQTCQGGNFDDRKGREAIHLQA